MTNKRILLIGGSGRSGTTILQRIFSLHPDVSKTPESRFLIDPDGIIDFYSTAHIWSPYHYDLKIKRLEKLLYQIATKHPLSRFFSLLRKVEIFEQIPWKVLPGYFDVNVSTYCPNFNSLVEKLINALTSIRYNGHWTGGQLLERKSIYYAPPLSQRALAKILGDFLRGYVSNILNYQKCKYYLEKNTWNILWTDSILELLPDAKMVHIFRDPRDVVASYTRQTWMPSNPEKCAVIYRDILNRWQEVRKKIPPDSYLEISLESLVESPKKILKKICDFWDIPWHNSLLIADLSKSNAGRWKKDFDLTTQKKIQAVVREHMEYFGFEG